MSKDMYSKLTGGKKITISITCGVIMDMEIGKGKEEIIGI